MRCLHFKFLGPGFGLATMWQTEEQSCTDHAGHMVTHRHTGYTGHTGHTQAKKTMHGRALPGMKGQEVANVAWAFATLNVRGETVMAALASRAVKGGLLPTPRASLACPRTVLGGYSTDQTQKNI